MSEQAAQGIPLIEDDVRTIFATPAGQRVLTWLCDQNHVWETSHVPDTHGTAFNEGRRYVVLQLMERAVQPLDVKVLMETIYRARRDNAIRVREAAQSQPHHDPLET